MNALLKISRTTPNTPLVTLVNILDQLDLTRKLLRVLSANQVLELRLLNINVKTIFLVGI